jgi:hypothetical protein
MKKVFTKLLPIVGTAFYYYNTYKLTHVTKLFQTSTATIKKILRKLDLWDEDFLHIKNVCIEQFEIERKEREKIKKERKEEEKRERMIKIKEKIEGETTLEKEIRERISKEKIEEKKRIAKEKRKKIIKTSYSITFKCPQMFLKQIDQKIKEGIFLNFKDAMSKILDSFFK